MVFAHEIGHLMGCRHPDDNTHTGRGYNWSHYCGFQFVNQKYTVMNNISGSSIAYFSNPNVNVFEQCSTAIGTSNNFCAQRIISNAQGIGNYNTNNDECVFINGPAYIYNSNQTFNWCVNSSFNLGSNVTWAFSSTGYSYTNFGSGTCASKVGSTFPPFQKTIFIRMTAIVNGVTYQRVQTVTNWSYYNYFVEETPIESRNAKFIKPYISPNPAYEVISISNLHPVEENVKIQILSTNGQLIKEQIVLKDRTGKIQFNLDEIPLGLYLVKLYDHEEIITLPLILEK
jgi:hypothetical protein